MPCTYPHTGTRVCTLKFFVVRAVVVRPREFSCPGPEPGAGLVILGWKRPGLPFLLKAPSRASGRGGWRIEMSLEL